MEQEKQTFAARFDFLLRESQVSLNIRPSLPINKSQIASNCLRWLHLAREEWKDAPMKRGDVTDLFSRFEVSNSPTEAIRFIGSTFSSVAKLGKCFPLPIVERITIPDPLPSYLCTFDFQEALLAISRFSQHPAMKNALSFALRSTLMELMSGVQAGSTKEVLVALVMGLLFDEYSVAYLNAATLRFPDLHSEIDKALLLRASGSVEAALEWLQHLYTRLESPRTFDKIHGIAYFITRLAGNVSLSSSLVQLADLSPVVLEYEFSKHVEGRTPNLVEFPTVLDTASKSFLVQLFMEMTQVKASRRSASYFQLAVNRHRLFQDTMEAIRTVREEDLSKVLRVSFKNEPGVDEGGVKKEFFQLVFKHVLDPLHTFFYSRNAPQGMVWFNPNALQTIEEFHLAGMLLGLAVTNRVLLDLPFPAVFFQVLFEDKEDWSVEDVKEVDPALYQGLVSLLAMEEVDSLALTFSLTWECFGQVNYVNLLPEQGGGGDPVAVTMENRALYVSRYVRYILFESVQESFVGFRKGFLTVLGQNNREFMSCVRFTFHDLEGMVLGGRPLVLDTSLLEKSARYQDGFTKSSETVVHFWRVVHGLEEEDKRRLLKFVTGSDRVPIRGLGEIQFTLSRAGPDSDRLPTSHTCFDHLLLPDYQDEEKMKQKLAIALQHSEGFGSV